MNIQLFFSNKSKIKSLCILLFIAVFHIANAQTPVTYTANPTNAQINTALQGANVIISGGTLNFGNRATQIATFTGGTAAGLGISNGAYFSTGNVPAELGNTNSNIGSSYGFNSNTYNDPDLVNIDPSLIYDPVSYTFNVQVGPNSTKLNISYQFGSEEYPDWVGSPYDDGFGFFVSGPGITGVQNIAKSPNGQPTTINKINFGTPGANASSPLVADFDGSQSAYYINNGHPTTIVGGKLVPNNNSGPKPVAVEFNALTKKITYSIEGLIPNQTYTFKIAIADASNEVLDSGVFIEKIYGTLTIVANNDTQTIAPGSTGTVSVLNNDSTNGVSPATNVILSQVNTTNSNVNLNTTTGLITVAPGTPAGTYDITYRLCDTTFPSECVTAVATVTVLAAPCNAGTTAPNVN